MSNKKTQAVLCPSLSRLSGFGFVRMHHKRTQTDDCRGSVILFSVGHYPSILLFAGVQRLMLSAHHNALCPSLFPSLSLSVSLPPSLPPPSLSLSSLSVVGWMLSSVICQDWKCFNLFMCSSIFLPHSWLHCAFP